MEVQLWYHIELMLECEIVRNGVDEASSGILSIEAKDAYLQWRAATKLPVQ